MQYILEILAYSLGGMIIIIPATAIGYVISGIRGAAICAIISSFLTNAGYTSSKLSMHYGGLSEGLVYESFINPLLAIALISGGYFNSKIYKDNEISLNTKIGKISLLYALVFIAHGLSLFFIDYALERRHDINRDFGTPIGLILWAVLLFIFALVAENSTSSDGSSRGNTPLFKSTGSVDSKPSQSSREGLTQDAALGVRRHADESARDPHTIAGEELLAGKVDPTAWAHALAEGGGGDGAVKAAYVKFRVAEIAKAQSAAVAARAEQERQIRSLTDADRAPSRFSEVEPEGHRRRVAISNDSDIDGDWHMVLATPMGDQAMTGHMETVGSALSGWLESPEGRQDFNGTVEGNRVKFSLAAEKPMKITLKYDLVVDGDAISGKVKMGIFGSAMITGVRMRS